MLKLTDAKVRNVNPREKDYKIFDGWDAKFNMCFPGTLMADL